jgi:hypothetical protein
MDAVVQYAIDQGLKIAFEAFEKWRDLTGSCKAGRESFCRDKGIDVDNDKFTVYEFIELTRNSYGGEVIRKLS